MTQVIVDALIPLLAKDDKGLFAVVTASDRHSVTLAIDEAQTVSAKVDRKIITESFVDWFNPGSRWYVTKKGGLLEVIAAKATPPKSESTNSSTSGASRGSSKQKYTMG